MTTPPPEIPPILAGPVNQATLEIAAATQQNFLNEVRGVPPSDSRDVIAVQAERYPGVLFGTLAMHIAGVELPPHATPADRAKGVVDALHRIASTPSLFEAATGAPFSRDSTAELQAGLARAGNCTEEEAAIAHDLRTEIRRNGGLSRAIIPEGRAVELHYAGLSAERRFGGQGAPPQVLLKVSPAEPMQWTVQRYGRLSFAMNDVFESIGRPKGERKLVQEDLFTLLAAENAGLKKGQQKELAAMVGTSIRLGKVSTGTTLTVEHDFYATPREARGSESTISNQTLRLPLTLQQAYLGSSRDLPLF